MKKPVEQEVTLKSTPMLTPDGVEIQMNSVLYRPKWISSYVNSYNERHKGASGEIEALRVFFVNNTTRTFRVRCVKGCEEIIQFSNGCQITKLFGKLSSAKDDIWKKADQDLKDNRKKLAEIKFHENSTIKARRAIFRKKSVKLPKAV